MASSRNSSMWVNPSASSIVHRWHCALGIMLLLLIVDVGLHRGGKVSHPVFPGTGLAGKDACWELPLPFIVLGGVFGGIFVVEAAVTAMYVILVEVVLYREVSLKDLPKVMVQSMVMVGGILLILGIALAFTNFLVDAEVPQQLLN